MNQSNSALLRKKAVDEKKIEQKIRKKNSGKKNDRSYIIYIVYIILYM